MIWCTRGLDDIFRVTAGLTEHMVALRTPFEWETPRLRYRASPDASENGTEGEKVGNRGKGREIFLLVFLCLY